MSEPQVHIDHRAFTRLDQMGLQAEHLRDSAEWGVRHLYHATANEPPIGPSITVWSKTVRRLREHLRPLGWESSGRNFATTVSPDGKIALAVAAGDSDTGKGEGGRPCTRSPKGSETKLAVDRNQLTFSIVGEGFPRPAMLPDMQTWFLLLYLDDQTDHLSCELSLPARLGNGGFISDWRERIILPSTDLGAGAVETEIDGPEPTIDIEVRRRPSSE